MTYEQADLFAKPRKTQGTGWCWLCQGERDCDEPDPCYPEDHAKEQDHDQQTASPA